MTFLPYNEIMHTAYRQYRSLRREDLPHFYFAAISRFLALSLICSVLLFAMHLFARGLCLLYRAAHQSIPTFVPDAACILGFY